MSTHIWRAGSIDTYQCLINAFIKKDKQYILLNRACERLFPESKCPLTLVYSEQIRVIENSVVSSKKNIKSCNWKTIQLRFWIYSHLLSLRCRMLTSQTRCHNHEPLDYSIR